jgi:hypothetical protein
MFDITTNPTAQDAAFRRALDVLFDTFISSSMVDDSEASEHLRNGLHKLDAVGRRLEIILAGYAKQ